MVVSQTSQMCGRRVLLTGAFGGVGEWILRELCREGAVVTCFDVASSARKARRLSAQLDFSTIHGDLTDPESVSAAVNHARPEVILHVGAIIPPLSIRNPDLARRVNVDGTRHLMRAAAELGSVRRVVYTSSYSVHGSCNPTRDPAPWTGDTPLAPGDDYGRQKAEAEGIVAGSGLETVVIRFCAVLPLTTSGASDAIRFSFLLPYDRRSQGIDPRDAARAVVRAAHVPAAAGRVFDVGGGEGWSGTGGEMINAILRATGVPALPRDAYRLPSDEEDASWYYENWVDTSESQAVLDYQRHTFPDYLVERRRRLGPARFVLPLFGGLIRRQLLRQSPFHGTPPMIDRRAFADAAATTF